MKTVVPIWAFFLITGVFVSLVVPLGEGFDEPFHFSYVQYVAQTGKLPGGPSTRISAETESFLLAHPIGWRLKDIFTNLHSQEEYWHSPDRQKVDATLRNLRFAGTYRDGKSEFTKQYESHQAPLYYIISAPLFWLCSKWLSFAGTFLVVRLWSVLLASAVVPLSYALAKRVSASDRTVIMVPMLVAMFPGIYPDVVRVSNDALAVPVAAWVFLALARYVDSRSSRDRYLLAIGLVVGLLTKAFFVPILIATLIALLWLRDYRAILTTLMASSVGWIWYLRNLGLTGSVTGLPETVAANTTIASSMTSLANIDWFGVLRLAAVSHIWIGNWSLLQYRSWMYDTILVIFGIGLFGFVAFFLRSKPRTVSVLLLVYACFVAALIYYATQVFQQTGIPVIQGWYLSPMMPIEALVFVLGVESLTSRWLFIRVSAFVATCFLVLTIYGNAFIAAPYYTNLTEHASSGHLRAYHPHWRDVPVIAAHLTRFYPWMPNALPVIAAIAATLLGIWIIWSYLKTADYAT